MESKLSMPEVEALVEANRAKEKREQTFLAAIQGIDLDKHRGVEEDAFEQVKRRAEAKARGMSEDQLTFETMGIEVIEE